MWPTGRLTPDFKTIAQFRKDNGKALRGVCRQFVMLCQRLDLFAETLVAIDGSKFGSTQSSTRRSDIAHGSGCPFDEDVQRLQDKIAALKEQMRSLKEIEGGEPS